MYIYIYIYINMCIYIYIYIYICHLAQQCLLFCVACSVSYACYAHNGLKRSQRIGDAQIGHKTSHFQPSNPLRTHKHGGKKSQT